MAKTIYIAPFREMHGAYTKGGTITRRKTYRDAQGRIKGMSEPESYAICNPRDWKKKPAKGKELEHQLLFKQACAETKRILHPSTPEELATLHAWQERYYAQLDKGEPEAPIDPKTRKHKIYHRLDAFIRTCLLRQLQTQAADP